MPSGGIADNVEAVACCDLDGRPGFKLAITERDGRWYLYTGCLWHRGWSVVDVTDPTRPTVQKQGDLFYIAHLNAGLRVYDVSHARLPREVGISCRSSPGNAMD